MLIDREEFERIIKNQADRLIAEEYFQHGFFEQLSIHFNREEAIYEISSVFRARYYKNHVKLEIDRYGEVVRMSCDCPYCTSLNGCSHVGAVLLKVISLQDIDLPYSETQNQKMAALLKAQQKRRQLEKKQLLLGQKERSLQLIESNRQQFEKSTQRLMGKSLAKLKAEVELLYDFKGYPCLSVSYRVGQERFYLIKDLILFLERLKNHETVNYGKSLTLEHELENFDEDGRAQIEFIQKQREKIYECPFGNKSFTLDQSNLDEFFDLYQSLSLQSADLAFKEESIVFTLQCEEVSLEDEKLWRFTIREDLTGYRFGKKGLYEYRDTVLIKKLMDEDGKGIRLLEEFKKQREILVPSENIHDFYKYVLSDLEEWFSLEAVESGLLPEKESEICLYGDVDESGLICLTVSYMAGGIRYYGFDEMRTIHSLDLERIEKIISWYGETIDPESHQVYFSASSSKAYEFAQLALPELQKYCTVYVSDALKTLGEPKRINLKVGLSFSHDLLEINLDSLDVEADEIVNLLRSYRRRRKFYRLKNGQLISLASEELKELDTAMEELDVDLSKAEGNQLVLPAYRAFAADEISHRMKKIQFIHQKPFDTFLKCFKQGDGGLSPLPKRYDTILRDYQKTGVTWLKRISSYGFGGILADDMGLGKTLQMIAYLESEKQSGRYSLVVCPSSLILNWQDEIRKFSPALSCLPILGSAAARKMLSGRIRENDVAIISYDYLRRDIDQLKDFDFYAVILDEAQYIKNQKTRNALSVKQLKAIHRFALTGTPIENSLAELWSIFDFLMPDYLYSYTAFLNRFEKRIVKEKDEERKAQLKKLVEPFILRRNKKEVLKELPDKIEITYTINFEEEERKLYLANLLKVNEDLQRKLKVNQVDRISILAMLTRLRQICCEPRMIYENIQNPSSKLNACMELIETLQSAHQKVLLFSSFTSALELIQQELDKAKISYLTLTGQTDKETRRKRVMQFQQDDTEVFLISLKAGGTGLNLTAAEAVIHYDPWWNISAQNQATDRAYRIGQNCNVQVFKLIMKDSIEEKILELQEKKKDLADTFVEGSDGSISTMSLEEIADLLKESAVQDWNNS